MVRAPTTVLARSLAIAVELTPHRLSERRQRGLAVCRDVHVGIREALEILIIGLGIEIDGCDPDQFHARLGNRPRGTA